MNPVKEHLSFENVELNKFDIYDSVIRAELGYATQYSFAHDEGVREVFIERLDNDSYTIHIDGEEIGVFPKDDTVSILCYKANIDKGSILTGRYDKFKTDKPLTVQELFDFIIGTGVSLDSEVRVRADDIAEQCFGVDVLFTSTGRQVIHLLRFSDEPVEFRNE